MYIIPNLAAAQRPPGLDSQADFKFKLKLKAPESDRAAGTMTVTVTDGPGTWAGPETRDTGAAGPQCHHWHRDRWARASQ